MDGAPAVDAQDEGVRRDRIVAGLLAFGAAQSESGRRFARHAGMHPTDALAIVEILRAGGRGAPLTPARLGERIGLTSGATSILLNRLEAAGHVTRVRGHGDRRLVTLHPTEAVHAEAEAFFAPRQRRIDELMRGYGAEELALVERFVTELAAVDDDPSTTG